MSSTLKVRNFFKYFQSVIYTDTHVDIKKHQSFCRRAGSTFFSFLPKRYTFRFIWHSALFQAYIHSQGMFTFEVFQEKRTHTSRFGTISVTVQMWYLSSLNLSNVFHFPPIFWYFLRRAVVSDF